MGRIAAWVVAGPPGLLTASWSTVGTTVETTVEVAGDAARWVGST